MKTFIFKLSFLVFSLVPVMTYGSEALLTLPVQDSGRIKPYDSFARETLQVIYGKQSYEGKRASDIVLTWMLAPEVWANKELFEVRNSQVLSKLGLDEKKRWYKGIEIFDSPNFMDLMAELKEKRETKEKLNPYFQALSRLENQYYVFKEMATGHLLKVVPPIEGDTWLSVADLPERFREPFMAISKAFAQNLTSSPSANAREELNSSISRFQEMASQVRPELYPPAQMMSLEVFYNSFHPFQKAYILYLISALLVLTVWLFGKNKLMTLAWALTAMGFLVHTIGFGIRIYLSGRAPVSNMYETVVWVAWGAVVFSAILELIYKKRFILLAGCLTALFALVVADQASVVLDPSIQPLEAVLRSNFWLTIHVMTIAISYAAFFLAFFLGDLGLLLYLKNSNSDQQKIKDIVLAIYKSIQIGVAFLAPGIILGGIWADYSWGRFWGWDPKETWALIVLLGYMAVLHGRMTSWIKDFGMIACSVVTFALVIMAWYGVNFVLGAGLHSYGFGAGGVEYVSVFVAAHFALVFYVWWVKRPR